MGKVLILASLGFLLAAGCRASGGAARASNFDVPRREGGTARVRVAVEEDLLRVHFESTFVDRWGVWIEDGAGLRVEPQLALDGQGLPVELGGPESARVQSVFFPMLELASRPWTLCVLPRGARAWRVVLAEVEESAVDDACEVFGYRRETWTFPDGETRVTYARNDPAGERIELSRSLFLGSVRPSVALTVASLPGTTREALAVCPSLTHVIALGFERGARYRGPSEGDNFHPHARGELFWSRPRFTSPDPALADSPPPREDPIDSLVWFLVELFNAGSADSYRHIWQGVLDGDLSEEQYVAQETLQKAAQVRRAVTTIQAHADCLRLAEWRAEGAVVFAEYERWVDTSGGDLRSLARIILRNPARYTLSPAEAGLTYGERLERLYRRYARNKR